MTGDKNWFSSLTRASRAESVTFGDASTTSIVAKGTVKVNDNFMFKDVVLVENLKYNLLSVSQMIDEDLEVCFKRNECKVLDASGSLVFDISRFGRVFKADFHSLPADKFRCLVADGSQDLFFWHRRLGHVGFDHLTRVSGMDLIRGLPKLKNEKEIVCSSCRHGKMCAGSHPPITMVMTKAPGQLLHLDTVGPSRVQSFGGKWYVLVIVDDFSRYSWVFFMASKDEAFSHFRNLALRLSLDHPGSLRAIRSDNGTEFKNCSFEHFCAEKGIDHQFSSPYVPQQNGVVERKNRTLVEMARTMLDEFQTPRKFWAEAISTACYVSNRVFLRSKLGKTPFELRFEHRPNVSHFRVFGCKCFVLKSGNLDKFEARSTDGIFLGYAAHSRGYRVLVLETNRIIETCEVTFDESSPGTSKCDAGSGAQVQGESIFIDDEEDEVFDIEIPITTSSVVPSTTSTMEATVGHPHATKSSLQDETEPENSSEISVPRHIKRRHPPEQMIGGLNEWVTRLRFNDTNSHAYSAFVSSF